MVWLCTFKITSICKSCYVALWMDLELILFLFTKPIVKYLVLPNLVLAGDNQHPLHYIYSLTSIFSLTQVVKYPTYVSPHGTETLIDLAILSTCSHLLYCNVTAALSNSDHNRISLCLSWWLKTTSAIQEMKIHTMVLLC